MVLLALLIFVAAVQVFPAVTMLKVTVGILVLIVLWIWLRGVADADDDDDREPVLVADPHGGPLRPGTEANRESRRRHWERAALSVEPDMAFVSEQEYALFDLGQAAELHRQLATQGTARDLREAERLARWWGAFETKIDEAIIDSHRLRVGNALIEAWLHLQKVMATSPDDRTADDVDQAEADLRTAIFDAQEWGLNPDEVLRPYDPEGKF